MQYIGGVEVRAIFCDLAGTLVDFGCQAPVQAFVQVFANFGLRVSDAEVRKGIGLARREHLQMLLDMPRIAKRFHEIHGHAPDGRDLDSLYYAFTLVEPSTFSTIATPIPAALSAVQVLQKRGLKIGLFSGYSSDIQRLILERLAEEGCVADVIANAGDMASRQTSDLRAMAERLGVTPAQILAVGDTPHDVSIAAEAGMWSVGVAASSSMVGYSAAEWKALSAKARQGLMRSTEEALYAAGAHVVLETLKKLPDLVDRIGSLDKDPHRL